MALSALDQMQRQQGFEQKQERDKGNGEEDLPIHNLSPNVVYELPVSSIQPE